jgi:hypothetical protein
MDHPGPRPARSRARIFEERDVRAWGPFLIRVEEVVDGRIVLVDRLLNHPEPQRAGVEAHVLGSVPGDAGHMMNAFQLHCASLLRLRTTKL